jgi:hypothetical protein
MNFRMPSLSLRGLGIQGPVMPNPGKNSPAQDFGNLAGGFVGDVNSVGGTISSMLDKPFDATVKIEGPHRIADNVLNAGATLGQNIIRTVTK